MNLIVIPFAQSCRKAVFKEMTSSLISEYKEEINDYVIQPLKEIINTIGRIVSSIFSGIESIACGLKKICLENFDREILSPITHVLGLTCILFFDLKEANKEANRDLEVRNRLAALEKQ